MLEFIYQSLYGSILRESHSEYNSRTSSTCNTNGLIEPQRLQSYKNEVSREHLRVFCFSPLICLGEMEQKPLISYPQIFLKFLLYFMIDVMKKKIVFLNKPFIAFFILQVLKNSDFSYLSLHDFFRLFRPIIIERGNLCKFSLSQAMFVWHHAADSYTGSRCFYR